MCVILTTFAVIVGTGILGTGLVKAWKSPSLKNFKITIKLPRFVGTNSFGPGAGSRCKPNMLGGPS